MQVGRATEADGGALRALLSDAGLPIDDLGDDSWQSFLIARAAGAIAGVGAVERRDQDGLLRSLVVTPNFRAQGVGRRIVDALEADARTQGLRALYLLTESAQGFFAGLGYRELDRKDAPSSIRTTTQFSAACPSTATLMAKTLDRTFNVLFLCTHNSARSIMAEGLLNDIGKGRFRAFSAGSHPGAAPNPFAVETLARLNLPTNGLRSKPWDEFALPGAPVMDLVITVCDQAAGEVCPIWQGQPIKAHWAVEDPSRFQGSDDARLRKFSKAAGILKRRIELLVSLPLPTLERLALEKQVRDIGRA
jgi:arsenate reductase